MLRGLVSHGEHDGVHIAFTLARFNTTVVHTRTNTRVERRTTAGNRWPATCCHHSTCSRGRKEHVVRLPASIQSSSDVTTCPAAKGSGTGAYLPYLSCPHVLQVAESHESKAVVARTSFGIRFQVSRLRCNRNLCARSWSRELVYMRVTGSALVGDGAVVACVCTYAAGSFRGMVKHTVEARLPVAQGSRIM